MPQEHDEQLWNWLKDKSPFPGSGEFDSEESLRIRDDQLDDACWRLVSANWPTDSMSLSMTALGSR